MRFLLSTALMLSASASFAQDAVMGDGPMPSGVPITTSYSFSAPLGAKTASESEAEEQTYRRLMYSRSAKECADLLATIATSCTVVNISVSTQITRQPGVPDAMYANANVTMQVDLK